MSTPDLPPQPVPTPTQPGAPAPAQPAAPWPPPARPEYYRDPRLRSPVTATVLSLVPGVGQVYLGYTRLGFLHAAVASTLVGIMSINVLGSMEPLLGVFMVFFFLYNLVDAHRRAVLYNEALTRMEAPQVPDDLGTLSFGARIGAGILLILGGLLTLLHLRFGLSLEWLGTWWPVALIGLGLYLVLRAVRDHDTGTDAN